MGPGKQGIEELRGGAPALLNALRVFLAFIAVAAQALGGDLREWYAQNRQAYFDHPDQRLELAPKLHYPYVKVRDAEAESAFFQSETCRDRPDQCIYEWVLPLSTIRGSEEVAANLLYQWQRFEERYYWYTLTYLNNPVYWFFWCALDLPGIANGVSGGRLFLRPDPASPWVKYQADAFNPARSHQSVPKEVLPAKLEEAKIAGGVLKYAPHASAGKMRLDYYMPLPRLPRGEYCDGKNASFQLPVLYIPGFCIYVQGKRVWCTPGYEEGKPLWLDEGEANRRIREGISHATQKYYPEYVSETLKASMLPGGSLGRASVYAPLPWTASVLGAGATIAAVARPATDLLTPAGWAQTLNDVQHIAQIAIQVFRSADLSLSERIAVLPYYTQGILILLHEAEKIPGAEPVSEALRKLIDRLLSLPEPLLASAQAAAAKAGLDLDIALPPSPEGKVRKYLEIAQRLNRIEVLAGKSDPLKVPGMPGFWKLEEVKRWFPASNQLVHEAFGYQTFFQVFQTLQASIVPDYSQFSDPANPVGAFASFVSGLAFRPVVYWWIPFSIKIWLKPFPPFVDIGVTPEPPKARWLPPYWLPFGAAQTAWDWVSVPEAYAIPRVKGTPGDLGALSKVAPALRVPAYQEAYERALRLR